MGYRVVNGRLYPVGDIDSKSTVINSSSKKSDVNFEDILNDKIADKSFVISNHAAERLKNRNISFNEKDMNVINDGINKAKDKGSNECLILYKDVAMVASIRNRTIITAVDKESSKGNVFTNVDSVVLL